MVVRWYVGRVLSWRAAAGASEADSERFKHTSTQLETDLGGLEHADEAGRTHTARRSSAVAGC